MGKHLRPPLPRQNPCRGETFFQDIKTKQIYIVKTGEYLVFDIKKPEKVIIKKGFVEPDTVKFERKKKIEVLKKVGILKDNSIGIMIKSNPDVLMQTLNNDFF